MSEEKSEKTTEEQLSELRVELEAAQKKVDEHAATNSTLKEELTQQQLNTLSDPNYLAYLSESQGKASSTSEDTDLDDLNGAELTRYLKDRDANLEARMKEHFSSELAQRDQTISALRSQNDLEVTKARFSDFAEGLEDPAYKARAIEISNENPNWGGVQIRNQMKLEADSKALKELQSKEEKAVEEKATKSEKGAIAAVIAESEDLTGFEKVVKANELCEQGNGVLDRKD
jgi:hypothetical protein